MVRRFIDGDKDLTLGRTAALAELCAATLRVVPRVSDQWSAAIDAIEQITEMDPGRREDLVILIQREQSRGKQPPVPQRARRTG